jgi:hypothetical protein
MRQRFDEDRAELEAHFAERLQAYIELGETPEQAKISALKKFGETEAVMRKLQRQRVLNSPILWAVVCATGSLVIAYASKHFARQDAWISAMLPLLCFALYFWRIPRTKESETKKCRTKKC